MLEKSQNFVRKNVNFVILYPKHFCPFSRIQKSRACLKGIPNERLRKTNAKTCIGERHVSMLKETWEFWSDRVVVFDVLILVWKSPLFAHFPNFRPFRERKPYGTYLAKWSSSFRLSNDVTYRTWGWIEKGCPYPLEKWELVKIFAKSRVPENKFTIYSISDLILRDWVISACSSDIQLFDSALTLPMFHGRALDH